MKRRGFLATLLGGAAAAVWPWKIKDEPKKQKIAFTNDWTSKIKSVTITIPGDDNFDLVISKKYGRGSIIHQEAKKLYREHKEDEIWVLPSVEFNDD